MLSSAIVILVLFILAVVALLLSYYLRRLRSQPLRQPDAAAPVQSSHSRRRQVSPAPSSAGLLLPRFKFSDLKRPGSVTVGGDCAICLAEFEPDHQLRLLPLCLHAFHEDCIDTWLAGESLICPVCRSEVFRSDSDLLQTASSGGSFRLASAADCGKTRRRIRARELTQFAEVNSSMMWMRGVGASTQRCGSSCSRRRRGRRDRRRRYRQPTSAVYGANHGVSELLRHDFHREQPSLDGVIRGTGNDSPVAILKYAEVKEMDLNDSRSHYTTTTF